MAQQPNVEVTAEERPRPIPQPGPAHKSRSDKPGLPTGPEEVPSGPRFGTTGPDPGWALRLLSLTELPDDDPRLRRVVTGLMLARSAVLGRAPVPEDIEVALILCGYMDDPPPELVERRHRWLEAVPHETRPGETAAWDVDRSILVNKPDELESLLRGHYEGR